MSLTSLRALLENPVFLSAVTSLFLAQLIKTFVYLLRSKRRSLKGTLESLVWRTGGMPSSHSALVSSLAAATAFSEGFNSTLFIVTAMVALITIRDSVGVRRSSGLQARALNSLGKQLQEKSGIEYHPVKEINGHTPLEVAVGTLLGIFIAAAYRFL
jgi:acid phosphatase family membrane protein YuiD